MNKTVAIIVFSSLFFLALTFILLYVQLYDDYVAAINGGRGYIVFLMVMAALSLLILVLIGGWLFWELLRKDGGGNMMMRKKTQMKKKSSGDMDEMEMDEFDTRMKKKPRTYDMDEFDEAY